MGAVNLKIERPSSRELSILPDPPGSGYYTKGYLVQDPTQPGTYVPTGLTENGSGLYNVPPVAYTGYNTDNLKDYSVVEDATTINASTYSGGFGQLTVPINQESPDIIRVINDTATLSDPVMGKITGTVRNLQNSDGDITVVADSILGLFNADKVVAPFTGTLYDAFSYYCQVAEIPIELVVVDLYDENDNLIDDVANRPVTFPGWVGNMWDHLKEILVSQQLEMSQVFDQVYVRPLRQIVANTDRNRSFGWAIDNQTASRQIQMNYYPTQRLVDGEFYPTPGEDATVYQVDAGEIMTFTLQLPHSLEYVNQPDCVDFVENRPYPNTNGVYSVAGNDGLPVTAAQWKAQGGNLTVRLTDDPSVVEVTITGASDAEMAPYRIAMTSGEFYNSLHLTGTGLFQEEKSVLIHTGATSAVTGDDIGVVVQNRNIQTLGQALTLGAKVAGAYALAYTISGEAFNLNRADASRDAIVAVVKDLDEYNSLNIPGSDHRLSDFNTLWTSFPQFDQFWLDYVDGIYENQAFGNAAGARVLTPDSNFRIDNATLTPAGISYSGSLDTIISDYDKAWIPEGAGSVNAINYHPTPRGTSTTLWGYQLGAGETAATSLVTEATVKRTNLARRPRGGAFLAASTAWGTGGAGVVTRPTGPVSNGPYFSYGDSWSAAATYAQVWPERVQVISGFSGLVNRGVSGDRMQMAVARMMNGASAWVPGTDGVVTVGALLNNLGSGDTAENRRTALESARAAAAYLSAAAKYEQTDARFAYTGTWSTLTADYCSGGTAAYRAPTITTPGEFAAQYVDVSVPAGVNYVSFLGTAVDSTPRGAVWVAFDLASGSELGRIDSHAAAVPTPSGPGGVVRSPVVWRVPGTTARTIRLRLTGPAGYTGDVMGIIDGLITIDPSPPTVAMLKPVEVLYAPYQIPALLAYLRTVPDVVAAEFSNVVPVDPAPGWAPASMLGADLLHPNEVGQEHVAVAVSTALTLPHSLGDIAQTTQLTWSTAPSAVPAGTIAYSVVQNQPAVTPGKAYSIEFAASAAVPQPMQAAIQWLTASGASAGVSVGSVVTVGPSGSSLSVVDAVAPAGAATMRADLRLASGASIWSVGDWVRAGELALLDMPGSAFDGFTPPGSAGADGSQRVYAWAGVANASPSTEAFNDGPLLPDGSRIGTYVRRTVTALKTGGNSGPWCRTPAGTVSTSPGVTVAPTMYVRFSVPVSVNVQSSIRSGSGIVSTTTETRSIPAGEWVRLGQAVTATANGDNTQIWATLAPATILPVGTTVDTTGGMTTYGSALVPYFDGSSLPYDGYTYRWAGAANNSASERLIAFPPLDTIDENWGAGTTVNDFSLASLRRNI